MSNLVLSLESVTKRFGANTAVHLASAQFKAGQIHGLVGENGAGKSTMLAMAAGLLRPDEGRVLADGQPVIASSQQQSKHQIGLVHQHFMLIDAFTALDNIMLGNEPTLSFGRLDRNSARSVALRTMKESGLEVELDVPVSQLGVGERQTLEILRVLVRGARFILLDEPTAVLTPGQSFQLFETLKRLRDQGCAVVVVTHRIREILEHCDVLTVMRRGEIVANHLVKDIDSDIITREIMGREPLPPLERPDPKPNALPSFQVEKLTVRRAKSDRLILDNISFQVKEGEILGLAGVEGNGQQELVEVLAGLRKANEGRLILGDKDITLLNTAERRDFGLTVVHADRHREGLLLDTCVGDNLMLGDLGAKDEASIIQRRISKFGVEPPDPELNVRYLSGGNQQKIVVGRALDRPVKAAILAQPTRGVDLGAARTIHEAICQAARDGAAVLVSSADLAELRAICHRILVIAQGRIVTILPPEATEEEFGRSMLGTSAKEAQA